MTPRSNQPVVRNPVLGLPSAQRIHALSPEIRAELAALLVDLSRDASARADKCWNKHKGPMAVYWKAVAVYARHIARAVRP